MTAFEAPPPYSALPTGPESRNSTTTRTSRSAATRVAHSALPPNAPPTTFKIGSRTIDDSLLPVHVVKGHLSLLHAFAELRKRVGALRTENIPNLNLPPNFNAEKKWAWIVGLAVERFDVWCQNLNWLDPGLPAEVLLPPIDVLMVWHAYMLNPRWYEEDCSRIDRCKTLKGFEWHFQRILVNGFSETLPSPPSVLRVRYWESKTKGMHFDVLDAIHYLNKKTISCLVCTKPFDVDLMNEEGTGYLQQRFRAFCPLDCFGHTVEITKASLALRKFASDVVTPDLYLAGTECAVSSFVTKLGDSIKKNLLESSRSLWKDSSGLYKPGTSEYRECQSQAVMRYSEYSLSKLKERLGRTRHLSSVGRIMAAYNDEKVYSVELVGAVLRQGSFLNEMSDLGWTRPGYFDNRDDEMCLHFAIARYHAFLDLMSSSPSSFFVPTLDIDLVWHTHQLLPSMYSFSCKRYLKRFIDHDDKVEGPQLSSAFDSTCRAWKSRFNVEYTHCGCPVPEETIGQRLSSMVGLSSKPPLSYLVPHDRPDLLSATHPSDHNAVHFAAKTGHAHEQATANSESLAEQKRQEREPARSNGQPSSQAQTLPPNGPYGFNIPIPVPIPVPLPIYFGNGMFIPPNGGFGACAGVGGGPACPFGGCAICGSAGGSGGGAWAAPGGRGGAGGPGVGGGPGGG